MQQPMDFGQLAQLAQSRTGQQLLALLQQTGGDSLQKAVSAASAGDYTQARNILSGLLENSEVKKLMQQLGGNQ